MKTDLRLEWERYALIVELAQRLQGKHQQFGKTALQKLIYFLQEVYNVDCGYEFRLYTYGPFTSQVLQDLDLVESFGGVKVIPKREGLDGYQIEPHENGERVQQQAGEFLDLHSDDLDTLIKEYGRFSAKELEMRATIIYVEREMNRDGKSLCLDDLVRVVHDIKPYFSEDEIASAVKQLKSLRHVKVEVNGE